MILAAGLTILAALFRYDIGFYGFVISMGKIIFHKHWRGYLVIYMSAFLIFLSLHLGVMYMLGAPIIDSIEYFLVVSKNFQGHAAQGAQHGSAWQQASVNICAVLFPFCIVVMFLWGLFKPKTKESFWPLSLICCAHLPYLYQRLGSNHVLLILSFFMLALALILREWFEFHGFSPIVCVFGLGLVAFGLAQDGQRELDRFHLNPVYKYRGLVNPLEANTGFKEHQNFIKALKRFGGEEDFVFVFCIFPQAYTFTSMKQASFVRFVAPWKAMNEKWRLRWTHEVKAARPKVIVVDEGDPFFEQEYPELASWIEEEYEPIEGLGKLRGMVGMGSKNNADIYKNSPKEL
jgi:hypothetical protein